MNSPLHGGRVMSYDDLRKGRYSEQQRVYFVTVTLAERERRYFADFSCARRVVAEMRALHDEGVVRSLAWVIMPDHVHWLFQLEGRANLSAAIKRFKACSARKVNGYFSRHGAIWQKSFYDHALRKEEDVRGIARYIVANPLRAGLVEHIGDYPLWDAIWL